MEPLIYPLIIYFTAGLAVAALLALGVARTVVVVEILGRSTDPVYTHAALLVMAALFWPLVVWMLLVGRKRERIAAQAEMDMKADEARIQRFAATGQGLGVGAGLARE